MSDLAGRRIEATAFRARRFPAILCQQLRVRNGPPLPAAGLPRPPLATDSAAAPRAPLRAPSPPPPLPRQPVLKPDEAREQVPDAPRPRPAVWRRTRPPDAGAPSTGSTQIGRGSRYFPRTNNSHRSRRSVRASTLVLALAAGLSVNFGIALWLTQIDQLAIASRPAIIATNSVHDNHDMQDMQDMTSSSTSTTPAIGALPPPAPKPAPLPPQSTSIAQPPVSTIDVRRRQPAAATKQRSLAAAKEQSTGGPVRRIAREAPEATTRAMAAKPQVSRGELRAKRKGVRSDEIGRLKSQAYAESSRDRLRRSPPPARTAPRSTADIIKPVSATSSKTPASVTRIEFKRCEKIAGLLQREKCKWTVCGTRWENDGCPSFASSEKAF